MLLVAILSVVLLSVVAPLASVYPYSQIMDMAKNGLTYFAVALTVEKNSLITLPVNNFINILQA
jgi:hypothetical protein